MSDIVSAIKTEAEYQRSESVTLFAEQNARDGYVHDAISEALGRIVEQINGSGNTPAG